MHASTYLPKAKGRQGVLNTVEHCFLRFGSRFQVHKPLFIQTYYFRLLGLAFLRSSCLKGRAKFKRIRAGRSLDYGTRGRDVINHSRGLESSEGNRLLETKNFLKVDVRNDYRTARSADTFFRKISRLSRTHTMRLFSLAVSCLCTCESEPSPGTVARSHKLPTPSEDITPFCLAINFRRFPKMQPTSQSPCRALCAVRRGFEVLVRI